VRHTRSNFMILLTSSTKLGVILTSLLVTISSVLKLQGREGLPKLNQVASWTLLGTYFAISLTTTLTGN
jgi:hypothetical protein